ncbi:MAG: transporter substrate-binding domain-containing protein, partial [Halothiobacillaceae bacterium]|nr:transporter substrate-binding domain-containing protein [Halothiobacillaceae bacterium]
MSRTRLLSRLALTVAILLVILSVIETRWSFLPERDGRRLVKVGLYENAPKIFTDANGHPSGLFVELLDDLARRVNWRLEYTPCEWADCLSRLERGELDLMPDVAFSAERLKYFDFHSVSVANSWSQVYARPELSILTLTDLAGRRIAVLQSGIQQKLLTQLLADMGLDFTPLAVSSLDEGYQA